MKINIRNVKIGILFIVLFFSNALGSINASPTINIFLGHIDDGLAVFFWIYIILNHKYLKENNSLLFAWLIYLVIGFISSMMNSEQVIIAALIDSLIISSRFVVSYLAVAIYCKKRHAASISFSRPITQRLVKISKLITFVLFVIALHDIFMSPFFGYGEMRYSLHSLKLMFTHPTYLAAASFELLIIIGMYSRKFGSIVFMLMDTFLCVSTLRGKAIAIVAIYWLLFIIFLVLKRRNLPLTIALGGFAAWMIGADQLSSNFATVGYSPRLILLKDGINIFKEYFPLGSGFGTFGSAAAALYYSPLYYQLGYPGYYGLRPKEQLFLTDDFWPSIIAQVGIGGLLVFIYIIYFFIKKAFALFKESKVRGFSDIMILAYLLITSIAETSFFGPTAMILFILFALIEYGE